MKSPLVKFVTLALVVCTISAATALSFWARPDAKPRLDATFNRLVQEKRFDELLSHLSRQQLFFSLAAPLGSGKNNLSCVHYLKGKTHYEKMEALKESEDWQTYYKTAGQRYHAIHSELNQALDFDRSSRLDVQIAYMDWRMYVERNSVQKTDEAFLNFKAILMRYVERSDDTAILKEIADALVDDEELNEYVRSLYSAYARGLLSSAAKSGVFMALLRDGLTENANPLLVQGVLAECIPHWIESPDTDRSLRAIRHALSKVFFLRDEYQRDLLRTHPKDYHDIPKMNYVYGEIIRYSKQVLNRHGGHRMADYFKYMTGISWYRKNEFKKAAEAFKEVVFTHPNSQYTVESFYRIAECYARPPDPPDPYFLPFLEEVRVKLAKHPEAPRFLFQYACVYLDVFEDKDKALNLFQDIIRLYPESDFANAARQELSRIDEKQALIES